MQTPVYTVTITVGGSSQTTETKIGNSLPQSIITRQSGQLVATFVDAAGAAFDMSGLADLDLFAKPFNSAEVPVNMGTGVISGAGNNIYTVSWVRDLIPAGWSSFAEDRDGTIVLYLQLQETGTADYYQWSTRFNVEDGDYVGDASVLPLVNLIFYYNPMWGYNNTITDADPGAGLFRLNNAALASVTEMYISDDNQSSVDLSAMVQGLGIGANIYLGNPNVKTDAACFVVSGSIINNTGYSTVPVTFKSSGSSAFTNGTIISFSFMFTGLTDGSVTNAKLADMAQSTIKGRAAGAGTGVPVDLSKAQALTILNVEDGADVTDETNVVAALDGATLTAATVASGDKILGQDLDDSGNLKTYTAQSIADLGSGSGEINTSSNSGAGSQVAQAKSGVDLPFRSFVDGEAITWTQNTDDLTADLDIASLGVQASPASGMKLVIDNAGTSEKIDWDDLPGAAGGETNTVSNVGGFSEVSKAKSGVDFPFRTLQSSDSSLTLTENTNDIDIVIVSDAKISAQDQTGTTYQVTAADWSGAGFKNTTIFMNNASPMVLTLALTATEAHATDQIIDVVREGAGTLTITSVTGVDLNGTDANSIVVNNQFQAVSIMIRGADDMLAIGDYT